MEIVSLQNDSPLFQREPVRGTSYPNYELDEIIQFVTKVYTDLGFNQYHDKELIAKVHGLVYQTIKQKLSTAQQYGLLELKHGVGYRVTPLFIKVYKPIDDKEKHEAILGALTSPDIYKFLFNQYHGHIVPSSIGLSTILFRNYGLGEKAAEKAADIFLNNLRKYALINSENILSTYFSSSNNDIQQEIEVITEEKTEKETTVKQPALPTSSVNAEVLQPEILEITIPLKSGKRAFLRIPENFQPEDLDRISKFVDALK